MSLTLTLKRGGGTASGTGTNITLNGTMAGGPIESIEYNGNTTQQTYSGKNLFNKDNASYMGGYFEIGGTINTGSSSRNRLIWIPCEANTTYSLTKATGTWSGGSWALGVCHETPAAGVSVYNPVSVGRGTTYNGYTTDSSATYLILRCQNADSTTYGWDAQVGDTGLTVWQTVLAGLQFEKSSTATSYEPYVGGVASPNPDYPQTVDTVTGLQTITMSDGGGQSTTKTLNLGKNLFDKDNANTLGAFITSGATHTISADGTNSLIYVSCQPNTTYTISKIADNVFRAGTTDQVPANGVTVSDYVDNATGTSITLTTSPNAKYIAVFVRNLYSTKTLVEILASLQIEKSSSASTYAPFVGYYGKNMLNPYEVMVGYRLAAGGTPYAESGFTVTKYIPVKPNTTYTISKSSSTNYSNLCQYDSTQTMVGTREHWAGSTTTFTLTTREDAAFIRYSGDSTQFGVSVQIEEGSTATTYEKCLAGPLELCKIGDYKDKIYEGEDGWYVHKMTTRITLDGSEHWTQTSAGIPYTDSFTDYALSGNTPISNYFIGDTNRATASSDLLPNHIGFNTVTSSIRFWVKYLDKWTTGSAVATWLASNPVNVYYALRTASVYDVKITYAPLIADLDAIKALTTYEGQTVFTVTGNTASPLSVSVEKSVEKTYTEVELGSPFTISDVEGKSQNTTLDGNIYVDFAYNKKQFSVDLFNLTPADYADIRGFYEFQFTSGNFTVISIPELNISQMPVFMEMSSRNIINQCLLTDKITIKFRETVQP